MPAHSFQLMLINGGMKVIGKGAEYKVAEQLPAQLSVSLLSTHVRAHALRAAPSAGLSWCTTSTRSRPPCRRTRSS